MNATINGQTLELNLFDVLATIRTEDVPDLVDSLACQDAVIEAVGQLIIHGSTDRGSYGWESETASHPSTPLDRLRREIAKAHAGLAREEIEKLEKALAEKEEVNRKLRVETAEFERLIHLHGMQFTVRPT